MKCITTTLFVALLNLVSFAAQKNEGVDPSKKGLNQWAKEYVNYPTEQAKINESGLVLVYFEISMDGKMENVTVDSSLPDAFKLKAVEMVEAMPKQHLYANGFIEGTRFVLPIEFQIR